MTLYRTRSGTLAGGPPEMVRWFLLQGSKALYQRKRHDVRGQGLGRKARVLAVVHGWMPYLSAGSERMMQHMISALPSEDFEVSVLSFGFEDDRAYGAPYVYDGLRIETGVCAPEPPDIIITHHGPAARVVMDMSEEFPNARIVSVYHNERYDIPDIQDLNADLEVYNTDWVREKIGRGTNDITVHPPMHRESHRATRGSRVTLCNLQENKGVKIFEELARRLPGVEFLGVLGTHGKQEPPDLPNVQLQPVVQDMREVWSQTKILLAPSEYESYGMVAAEACASGIPVLANPTPGLVECLGPAGTFIPRDDIDAYERTLRLYLEDPAHYAEKSAAADIRGTELEDQTRKELAGFIGKMKELI